MSNDGKGEIPVKQPRTYFGELVTDYAIVGSPEGEQPREYDTDTQRYEYTGQGGVPLGNWIHRLIFAAHHGERNILFNQAINNESKIIYERNPQDRLVSDGDPATLTIPAAQRAKLRADLPKHLKLIER